MGHIKIQDFLTPLLNFAQDSFFILVKIRGRREGAELTLSQVGSAPIPHPLTLVGPIMNQIRPDGRRWGVLTLRLHIETGPLRAQRLKGHLKKKSIEAVHFFLSNPPSLHSTMGKLAGSAVSGSQFLKLFFSPPHSHTPTGWDPGAPPQYWA